MSGNGAVEWATGGEGEGNGAITHLTEDEDGGTVCRRKKGSESGGNEGRDV